MSAASHSSHSSDAGPPPPPRDWRSCAALVTGGKRGLGYAYARELARRGSRVVITSRNPSDADVATALDGLRAEGAAAPVALAWDAAESDADARLESALRDAGIEIDLFVHSAHAFAPHRLILATPPRDLADALTRNVVGPYALLRRLARGMARRDLGRVLVVGSLAASLGGVGQLTYITEKSAMVGIVRAFSAEMGRRNVLVNMVEPGIIDTENVRGAVHGNVLAAFARRTVAGRLATADEVVRASIGLLDPQQGFVTGQILRVAGGADLATLEEPAPGG